MEALDPTLRTRCSRKGQFLTLIWGGALTLPRQIYREKAEEVSVLTWTGQQRQGKYT